MTQDYLEHYGKKGMKWGVRKKIVGSGRKVQKFRKANTRRAQKLDAAIFRKLGLENMAKGVETSRPGTLNPVIKNALKKKVSSLNTPENKKRVTAGATFVSGILVVAGRKALTSYARQEIMGQLVKKRAITGT
jgi:hypothetical protein